MSYVSGQLAHIPRLVRVRPGLYRAPEGREIHSVTRILGETHDSEFKSALRRWRATVGREGADYVTQRGAERGSTLHNAIEAYLCEQADSRAIPPRIKEFLDTRLGELLGVEVPLIHRTLPYAGTADLVGYVDGVLRVVDWKTSTKPPTWQSVAKYDVQIAAYAHALESWGLPRPEGFVLVQPDQRRGLTGWAKPEEFELPAGRIQQALEEFLARLDRYVHARIVVKSAIVAHRRVRWTRHTSAVIWLNRVGPIPATNPVCGCTKEE